MRKPKIDPETMNRVMLERKERGEPLQGNVSRATRGHAQADSSEDDAWTEGGGRRKKPGKKRGRPGRPKGRTRRESDSELGSEDVEAAVQAERAPGKRRIVAPAGRTVDAGADSLSLCICIQVAPFMARCL